MSTPVVVLVLFVVVVLLGLASWFGVRGAVGRRRAEQARAALAEADARLDRAEQAWTAAEERPAEDAARLGAYGDHAEATALELRKEARQLAPDVARAELARREIGDPHYAESDHRGARPSDVPPEPPARPRRVAAPAQPVNEGIVPPAPTVEEETHLPLPSTAEEFTPPGTRGRHRRTAGAVDEGPVGD
jgi:hypothetical protein